MKYVKHLEISEAVEWFGVTRNVPRNWIKNGKVSTIDGKWKSTELIVVPVLSLTPVGITKTKSIIESYPGQYGFILKSLQEYEKLREKLNLKIAYIIDIILCFVLEYGAYKKKYEFLRDASKPTSEFIAKYMSDGLGKISDVTYRELGKVIERQQKLLKNLSPVIHDYISKENWIAIPEMLLGTIMEAARIDDLDKLQFTADAMSINYILKAHNYVKAKPSPYMSRYLKEVASVKKDFPHLPVDKYLLRLISINLDEYFSKYSQEVGQSHSASHAHSLIPEFVIFLTGNGVTEFRKNLNFRIADFIDSGAKELKEKIALPDYKDSRKMLLRELEIAITISRMVLRDYLGIEWRKVACGTLKESETSFRVKKCRLHEILLRLLNEYDKVIRPFNLDNKKRRKPVDTVKNEDKDGLKANESRKLEEDEENQNYFEGKEDIISEEEESTPACDGVDGRSPAINVDCVYYYLYASRNLKMNQIKACTGADGTTIKSAIKKVENILNGADTEEKDALIEMLEIMKEKRR